MPDLGHDHGGPTGDCEQAVTGESFKDVSKSMLELLTH